MTYDSDHFIPPAASIKVIGIGGGGGNAVNTMIRTNIEGVDFITANTDIQALRFSLAEKKIQIGKELTKGLGAGADPDIGRDAMLEDRHAISEALEGAQMVFITAGMGGGTGTGGASVVAQIAREIGALTVGVVTKPFAFEGRRRKKHAEEGIARLRDHVDTLITIPNQRLLQIASPDLSMIDAFRLADNVLVNAVKGISDIINIPGTVNVDFADVKTVMSGMGLALMGIGIAEGPNRAVEAARAAICSPLLEDVDIEGATGILINITAGENVSLYEVNEACSIIQEAAHDDANIIFGAVIDENVGQQMRVTVIATGFPAEDELDDALALEDFNEKARREVLRVEERSRPIARLSAGTYQQRSSNSKSYSSNSSQSGSSKSILSSPVETNLESKNIPSFELPSETLTKMTLDSSDSKRIEGASSRDQDFEDASEKLETSDLSPSVDDEDKHTPSYHNQRDEPDMDRKIDEALKIAEQISKSPRSSDVDDDLEVPSFLRTDRKDLSLT
ncbi:MAG: cell division protein FtsZ [Oligoflexus sp.]